MRNTLLISAGALTMSAGVALATPPAPVPMPVFTWTDCYVGAHAGADSGHSSWSNVPTFGSVGMGTNGAIAGGQAGCNYQMQQFVIGAEGELWGSTLAGSTSRFLGGEGGGTYIFRTKSNFAGDVAARFGFAFDRVLLFSKVGVAWAHYSFSVDGPFTFSPDTGSSTYSGLLLGLGAEFAIDAHWSIKAEYDYINYGGKNIAMYQSNGVLGITPTIANTENI
ncbi:MAG: porin family protein, partial [Bradyrhizobium sp.]